MELVFDTKRTRVRECPCGRSNKDGKFVPYKGFEGKGYCHSCGNTFLPDQSTDNPSEFKNRKLNPYTFHPKELIEPSLNSYNSNNLVIYLNSLFGEKVTNDLIRKYYLGTSKQFSHIEGHATIFYYLDYWGNITAGKIMKYDPETGRRDKKCFNWVHSILNIPDYTPKKQFYGEHLLSGNTNAVAIFESEKSALIASVYFPEFVCLATGGKTGLIPEKCKVLYGRQGILFPDLSKDGEAFEYWMRKKKEIPELFNFEVSEILESNATDEERIKGMDMADFLPLLNLTDFKRKTQTKEPENPYPHPVYFYYANNDLSLYAECMEVKYHLNDLKPSGILNAPF